MLESLTWLPPLASIMTIIAIVVGFVAYWISLRESVESLRIEIEDGIVSFRINLLNWLIRNYCG